MVTAYPNSTNGPRLSAGAPGSTATVGSFQLSPKARRYLPAWSFYLLNRILSAASRLETSTSIQLSIDRFKAWQPTKSEKIKYGFLLFIAFFSLFVMGSPGFPLKLVIPALYTLTILVPLTSQFFLPAAPIFAWLILFHSCRFIPAPTRPHIWVSVLPTLETIWYGANISDILTQFGHPILDILAWIPYGIVHFGGPFFVAAFLFVFSPPSSVKVYANAFGFMMLIGVIIQIIFPCAPPWYELREGITEANYGMRGSPAGLARIDALFHSHGYTLTFTGAPMVFGAFPSLHAGNATLKALFLSYFFPLKIRIGRLQVDARVLYWFYCFWLYWCAMYLMHHYLIDLVAGACLATFSFNFFLPDEIRAAMEQNHAYRNNSATSSGAVPPSNRPRPASFASHLESGQQHSVESHVLDPISSMSRSKANGAPYISAKEDDEEARINSSNPSSRQRTPLAGRSSSVSGVSRSLPVPSRPQSTAPEVIFSIDDAISDSGDLGGSTAEDENKKKQTAAVSGAATASRLRAGTNSSPVSRARSPIQRTRSPSTNGSTTLGGGGVADQQAKKTGQLR